MSAVTADELRHRLLLQHGPGAVPQVDTQSTSTNSKSYSRNGTGPTENTLVYARFRPLTKEDSDKGHQVAWRLAGAQHIHLIESVAKEHECYGDTPEKNFTLNCVNRKISPKRGGTHTSTSWRSEAGHVPHAKSTLKTEYFVNGRVFGSRATNAQVYEEVARSAVIDAVEGYSGCILAYGQSLSGKTHTTTGTPESPGIILHSVADVFAYLNAYNTHDAQAFRAENYLGGEINTHDNDDDRTFLVRVSLVEIYMDRVRDLLRPSLQRLPMWDASPFSIKGYPARDGDDWLPVREASGQGFFVEGLSELHLESEHQVVEALALANSLRRRNRSETDDISSRSHTIFTLSIEAVTPTVDEDGILEFVNSTEGRLQIVDLAASEAQGAHSHSATESRSLYKDLFHLSEVINRLGVFTDVSRRLTNSSRHCSVGSLGRDQVLTTTPQWPSGAPVPPNVRGSVLTKLLAHTLINGRVRVIVNLHPSSVYAAYTASSLRFAEKASRVSRSVINQYTLPTTLSILCAAVQKCTQGQSDENVCVEDDDAHTHTRTVTL
eukprot:GHVR01086830.1.p1 GENE.GHVR01086830.1~~GHVR01086830.1.p1  ORF type:complete len:550 (+),score=127.52 GHVR01086830.1:59-1708(+)